MVIFVLFYCIKMLYDVTVFSSPYLLMFFAFFVKFGKPLLNLPTDKRSPVGPAIAFLVMSV